MKKFLLASVAIAAVSAGSALAADLPMRRAAPVPVAVPPPVYNWSGFYIGAHGGGAWGEHCFNGVVGADFGCHDGNGWLAGGQVGYNWQAGQWVFGLEFSGAAAGLDGNHTDPFGNRWDSDVGGLFLLTGRVGMAFNNVLVYVTGGGAWVHNEHTVAAVLPGSFTVKDNRWGWTIGGGVEFGFASNWSLAFQYNFIQLDERETNFSLPVAINANIEQNFSIATARLNYRFGGRY